MSKEISLQNIAIAIEDNEQEANGSFVVNVYGETIEVSESEKRFVLAEVSVNDNVVSVKTPEIIEPTLFAIEDEDFEDVAGMGDVYDQIGFMVVEELNTVFESLKYNYL